MNAVAVLEAFPFRAHNFVLRSTGNALKVAKFLTEYLADLPVERGD